MLSFNLTNRWQSIVKSTFSPSPRGRVRRQMLTKEPAMIEILEQRKVFSANVVMSAVSPDGHHTAQVVNTGVGTEEVIKDGVAIGSFQAVTQLQFSADGQHLAFVTHQNGHGSKVFLDGHPVASGTEFASVSSLKFSSDGKHLEFADSQSEQTSADPKSDGNGDIIVGAGSGASGGHVGLDAKKGAKKPLIVIIAILIG